MIHRRLSKLQRDWRRNWPAFIWRRQVTWTTVLKMSTVVLCCSMWFLFILRWLGDQPGFSYLLSPISLNAYVTNGIKPNLLLYSKNIPIFMQTHPSDWRGNEWREKLVIASLFLVNVIIDVTTICLVFAAEFWPTWFQYIVRHIGTIFWSKLSVLWKSCFCNMLVFDDCFLLLLICFMWVSEGSLQVEKLIIYIYIIYF